MQVKNQNHILVKQSFVSIFPFLLNKILENLLKNELVKWKWKHNFNWKWNMWKKIQWCSYGKMFEIYPSLEKKLPKFFKMKKNEWKWNLQKLYAQKNLMETSWQKCILLGFFHVNDNKNIECNNLKWCVVFFVMTIMSMYLIPKLKQKNA